MLSRALSAIGFGCMGLFLFGLELSELISPEQARVVTLVSGIGALVSFSWLGTIWLLGKMPRSSVTTRAVGSDELTERQHSRLMNALLNLSQKHADHFGEVVEDIEHDIITGQSLIRDCRVCGGPRFEGEFRE